LRDLLGPQVQLVDSGAPVARQARRVLPQPLPQTVNATNASAEAASHHYASTGQPAALQAMAERWVQPGVRVELLSI